MSKIALTPNASGSGTFTIAAPNSDTDRTLTLPDEAGTVLTSASDITQNKGSAFFARLSANQTFSDAVFTKIALDTEEFDAENDFDATTNYRFQPTVAGYYLVTLTARIGSSGGSVSNAQVAIYKNGSLFAVPFDTADFYNSASDPNIGGSNLVYLNGSTDYIEFYAYINTSGVDALLAGGNTWRTIATGCLVRTA